MQKLDPEAREIRCLQCERFTVEGLALCGWCGKNPNKSRRRWARYIVNNIFGGQFDRICDACCALNDCTKHYCAFCHRRFR